MYFIYDNEKFGITSKNKKFELTINSFNKRVFFLAEL